MKKLTTIFLVALQLLSHFHGAYAVTRLRNTVLSEVQADANAHANANSSIHTNMDAQTGDSPDLDNILDLGKACLGAFTEVIPDDVCYKQNMSYVSPTECPKGVTFIKSLNSNDCLESCREKHTLLKDTSWYTVFTGGAEKCYENCETFEHNYDNDKTRCEQTNLEGYGTREKNRYSPRKLDMTNRTECPATLDYQLVDGKCQEICKSGYSLAGGKCTKEKVSYNADSISTSDDRMMCAGGKYKFAGKCFSDCANTAHNKCEGNDCLRENCLGFGCSKDKQSCYSAVASTVLEVLVESVKSVVKIAHLPLVFTVTAIKEAVTRFIDSTASAFKRVAKFLKQKLTPSFIKKWKTDAIDKAWSKIKEWGKAVADKVLENGIKAVCQQIYEVLLKDDPSLVAIPTTKEDALKALDVFDLKSVSLTGSADDCDKPLTGTDTEKATKRAECAKKFAEKIKKIDPTGLVAVGAAFIKPRCPGI